MKKLFIITLAVMCLAGCGQRRGAKSQETQKETAQKDTIEAVEHHCASEVECERPCGHQCEHHAVKQAEQVAKEVADTVKKEVEKAEGAKAIPMGKRPDPKPIKPVPIPHKK
ncbi:MAG: hypothetical protein IKS71_04850 [Bacteroidales bacterium]|nr:hypothetical protein [Bacteroidales bacterium]